eukprot:m.27610 g.27610  ORF g.27610 m.27610 type:complete len:445 (-) comp9381_c0_seq1:395-1729(-)
METLLGKTEDSYDLHRKAGEGTFSEVIKGERLSDGLKVAIKRMKGKFSGPEQVDKLREVQALRRLKNHNNIIEMVEIIFNPDLRTLDLVFELMDMNIYERIKGRKNMLPKELVQNYMYQMCKGLDHMHRNGIFHRDIKPENILIRDEHLKIADLGSCRGVHSKPPFTEYISTRWYRAPECLLTNGFYGYKMDMWSIGCVMFEIISLYPLFPGSNELDQINRIHDIMGTPSPEVFAKIRQHSKNMKINFPNKEGKGLRKLMPKALPECVDLIENLLIYDPSERFSARQALKHPYLKDQRNEDKKRHRAMMKAKEKEKKKERLVQTDTTLIRRLSKEVGSGEDPDDIQLQKYKSFKARRKGSKKRSIKRGEAAEQHLPSSLNGSATSAKMPIIPSTRVLRRGQAQTMKEPKQTSLPPINVGGNQNIGRSFTMHHHAKATNKFVKKF